MKIAYFTDTFVPEVNGVTYAVLNFSENLAKRGHSVIIFCPEYERRSESKLNRNVVVERFRSIQTPTYKDTRIALPDFSRIYQRFIDFNPAVVHIHTPGTLGLAGMLIAKWRDVPLVGTYHTLISELPMYFSPKALIQWPKVKQELMGNGWFKNIAEGLETLRGNLGWEYKKVKKRESAFEKITWFLQNKFYNYCDLVIVPSSAIKKELVKRKMKKRVEVVSNGIDLENFWPKKNYRFLGKILYSGRVGYEKNIDKVIEAFAVVRKNGCNCELIVAGDGPAMNDMKILADKLRVTRVIRFLGMVPRRKLGRIYRAADVFVTASTMETQGLVILEAMASGLPVVGVDKYAISDMVHDGENGYVVKTGSRVKQSIARAVSMILDDAHLRERMGRNARKSVESHNAIRMAEVTEKLYTGLVQA